MWAGEGVNLGYLPGQMEQWQINACFGRKGRSVPTLTGAGFGTGVMLAGQWRSTIQTPANFLVLEEEEVREAKEVNVGGGLPDFNLPTGLPGLDGKSAPWTGQIGG